MKQDALQTSQNKSSSPNSRTNPFRRLPPEARKELREILNRDAGEEVVNGLTEEDIDHFGFFLLSATAAILKHKAPTAL